MMLAPPVWLYVYPQTFFPFELSSCDYAHRAMDLLTSVLLDACNRAVQQVGGGDDPGRAGAGPVRCSDGHLKEEQKAAGVLTLRCSACP